MARKELSKAEFKAEIDAGDAAAMKHRPGADDESGMKRLLFADGWMARAQRDDRPVAPWADFAGNQIRHGDRLMHPTGQEFTAVWMKGHEHDGDAWRAVYDDATVSRLGLQIGDKGQAALVPMEGLAWAALSDSAARDRIEIVNLSNQVDRLTARVNELQSDLLRANAAMLAAKGKHNG